MTTATQQLIIDQYRRPANLAARINLHERFSTNPIPWHRWVFDQFSLPQTANVLELGCGVGKLWLENQERILPGWAITLSDFSANMLQQTQENLRSCSHPFTFQVININDIPYATEQFDAVIANHMLYYVADKGRAFSEVRRVLKPGGHFYTTTNGQMHLQEMTQLVKAFDPTVHIVESIIASYTLENATGQVAQWFDSVETRHYPDSLIITEAQALVDYILSSTAEIQIAASKQADLFSYVQSKMAEQGGRFYISKDPGIFIAKKG